MARLPTIDEATGCERSTMPCLMAVTCTLSTTITVSAASVSGAGEGLFTAYAAAGRAGNSSNMDSNL